MTAGEDGRAARWYDWEVNPLISLLVACRGGSDLSEDEVPAPAPVPSADTAGDPVYPATWDGIQLLEAEYCASCHSADGIAPWDVTDTIEAQLVDGPLERELLVVPGDAGASALWQSLTGAPGRALMPWNIPEPLPPEVIGHVRQWIDAGALIP